MVSKKVIPKQDITNSVSRILSRGDNFIEPQAVYIEIITDNSLNILDCFLLFMSTPKAIDREIHTKNNSAKGTIETISTFILDVNTSTLQ